MHEQADATGDTPLHLAVRKQLRDAVLTLLALGASPTARNHAGQRPLDLAKSRWMHELLEHATAQT